MPTETKGRPCYTRACVHTNTQIHKYTGRQTDCQTNRRERTHVSLSLSHAYTHIHTHAFIHARTHVHTHERVGTHTHTHTHTHAHTQTQETRTYINTRIPFSEARRLRFLRVLRFPPLLHWFNGSANYTKLN